jgi:hypothetical protein
LSDTPAQLLTDLAGERIFVDDIWDLVAAKYQYPNAIPVLIDWLIHFEDRVSGPNTSRVWEGIVRSLTVAAARPSAAPALINEFRRVSDPTGLGPRWTVGNAIGVVMDDSVFDEVSLIVKDKSFGKARQMTTLGLGRSRDPRAVPMLIELLRDDDVAASALIALRKLNAKEACSAIEPLLAHSSQLIRKEAQKSIEKLC